MKFDKMPCIIYTDIELIRKIDVKIPCRYSMSLIWYLII